MDSPPLPLVALGCLKLPKPQELELGRKSSSTSRPTAESSPARPGFEVSVSLGRRDKLGGGSGSHLHPIAVWCRWPTTRPESRLRTTRVGAVPGTPRCPGLTDATEHAQRLPGVTLPRETRIRLPRGVHVSQWPGPPDPVLEQVLLPVGAGQGQGLPELSCLEVSGIRCFCVFQMW